MISQFLFTKSLITLLAFFNAPKTEATPPLENPLGKTISSRFAPPNEYMQVLTQPGTFANYLQHFPLKNAGTPVKYFNGELKSNNEVYAAVLDISTGNRDLQQCADAIIRLRAEYLYSTKQFDKIQFHFTNGFLASFSKWILGYRIVVKGNSVYWIKSGNPSSSHSELIKYLNVVFTYAGSLSLSKELIKVPLNTIQIGDVFIRGGSPGHAVLVVNMAVEKTSKNKLFLLVQSYMPAQDIHILQNNRDSQYSPWFSSNISTNLHTPEWVFSKEELMRFPN